MKPIHRARDLLHLPESLPCDDGFPNAAGNTFTAMDDQTGLSADLTVGAAEAKPDNKDPIVLARPRTGSVVGAVKESRRVAAAPIYKVKRNTIS